MGPLSVLVIHLIPQNIPGEKSSGMNAITVSLTKNPVGSAFLVLQRGRSSMTNNMILQQIMNSTDILNDETEQATIPTPQKLDKSKRVIDQMINTGQVSKAGFEWLKIATDPWHDNKVEGFKGIPDQTLGTSVVMSVVQELDISKPAGLPPGNWSVRISTNPVASTCATALYDYASNSGVRDPTAFSTTMYPVAVDFAAAGADFVDYSDNTTLGLKLDDSYLSGPYKVAGLGLEVVNTTAEIYQQGLCTCSRMNQNNTESFTSSLYHDAPNWNPVSTVATRSAPKNLAEMILLPSTTQWHAKEGNYSVVELLGVGSLPPATSPIYPLWMNSDFDSSVLVGFKKFRAPNLFPVVYPIIGNKYVPPKYPGRVPLNTSTMMYTGLSEQTTLTLRVRWIVERFPNDNQPEILVLATPTAAYDPVAIEMYSRTMRKLPPGVMFKENNSQDWWKTVLSCIADVASAGLLMMPHPYAKGAGAAIGLARNVLLPNEPVRAKLNKKNQVALTTKVENPQQRSLRKQSKKKQTPKVINKQITS